MWKWPAARYAGLVGRACDQECERDLQLATIELTTIPIGAADHPNQLQLTVADDKTDVYVHMLVPAGPSGCMPPVSDLSRLLLGAAVESYEMGLDGDQLLGVLRRALVDDHQP